MLHRTNSSIHLHSSERDDLHAIERDVPFAATRPLRGREQSSSRRDDDEHDDHNPRHEGIVGNSIQLRSGDLSFLFTQVSHPALTTRDVSGFNNNLTPGRELWGTANSAFLRLTPAHFAQVTAGQINPNAIRATSADGTAPLPNPRLISDIIGQQPLDAQGHAANVPNAFGQNLLLMTFGQFFDHGLDFYQRGGGSNLIPIHGINEDLAAAQTRLDALRAAEGLPPIHLDLTDNLLAQLQGNPQPFEFLIGSRAARVNPLPDGSIPRANDGSQILDNATGTSHVNKNSAFVDQSQTYGSVAAMTYLLRESAHAADGSLISDGHGGWMKTAHLLDGRAEVGPDGISRGTLPNYEDVLVNNGVSRTFIDHLLAEVKAHHLSDFAAWQLLTSATGFVNFADIGDANHTIMIGDKNDALASPTGADGVSANPTFSLEILLTYHVAGDHRADENVALTAIHEIFHREHNLQANRIAAIHPEWTAEQIFQAAKLINSAEYQRTVFVEFATAMSGGIPGSSHGFSGYNPNVNPGISDEFAGAMYRVGHSMINETIPFTDASGHTRQVPLFQAFLKPAMFDGNDPATGGIGGAAAIISGEVGVAHQRIDEQVVEVIRSHLLGIPLDLYAANIARARELGLPTLNEFRQYMSANSSLIAQTGQGSDYTTRVPGSVPSLAPYANWAEFGANLRGTPDEQKALLDLFKAAYGTEDIHVNDVELFVGGLAERNFGNSQMGSTFTWIFQEQLDRLQDGDRFYYFNQMKDDPLLIADIGAQHFSDIVMRNTGLQYMPNNIFAVSERIDLQPNELNHDFSVMPVSPDHVLVLVGNARNNIITGTAGDDTIYGGPGDDVLGGGLGHDALFGGTGDDVIAAGPGPFGIFAYGEEGDDSLTGNSGDDNLIGGPGDDLLTGKTGNDYLSGGEGNDRLMPGAGHNLVDGGAGIDTVDYSDSLSAVSINLGIHNDTIAAAGGYQGDVTDNVENAVGSNFADTVVGDGGRNRLEGGLGNDTIQGAGGADTLIGGGGADTFLFTALSDSTAGNRDVITDFSQAQGDLISLSAIDANSLIAGDQAFSFIGRNAFSHVAGQLNYAFQNGDTLISGDVDGDGVADFVIQLNGRISLHANDYFL